MADQQAEQDNNFRLYVNTETEKTFSWSRFFAEAVDKVRARASGLFAKFPSTPAARDDADAPMRKHANSGWLTSQRLPIILSLIWVLALGAYGIGYFARLSEVGDGDRLLPTMDLVFFCFAIAGPVAMVWIVAIMLSRAERLTTALRDQSETTLALATAITTLNDSVDALSTTTTGRLEETCEILDRQARNSSETMQKSLADVIAKVDTSLLDSVILLDRSTRERMDVIEETLASERAAFADRLDADATAMRDHMDTRIGETTERLNAAVDKTVADHTARLSSTHDRISKTLDILDEGASSMHAHMDRRIEETTERLNTAVEHTVADHSSRLRGTHDGISRTLQRLDDGASSMHAHIEKRIAETTRRLNAAIDQTLTDQSQHFNSTQQRLSDTLDKLAADVAKDMTTRNAAFGEALGQDQTALRETIRATARRLEGELVAPFTKISSTLDSAAHSIVNNPPATNDGLGRLVGETVKDLVGPEREKLAEGIARLAALEERAEQLLKQIDRTSRLNPHMDRIAGPQTQAAEEDAVPALPLGEMPMQSSRAPLSWTTVVRVLDAEELPEDLRGAMGRSLADPDVELVSRLGRQVISELAEDEIHVGDMIPELAPVSIWKQFADGARGGEIGQLAGIQDQISLAVVRGRLRNKPDFKALCLRFAGAYIALLKRAVTELGEDPYMVELAETHTGRAFMITAHLNGVFEHPLNNWPSAPD